jgi:ElaB/YqjD/DUF883 family membrane-anchored ribosome-binding protein
MAQEPKERTAEDLKPAGRETVGGYRAKTGQVWDDASERTRTFKEDAEQYVRENPTKAVLTALGIGFVLGLIVLRR